MEEPKNLAKRKEEGQRNEFDARATKLKESRVQR